MFKMLRFDVEAAQGLVESFSSPCLGYICVVSAKVVGADFGDYTGGQSLAELTE